MYTGEIYYQGTPITAQDASELGLITIDENGDIWLASDTARLIRIIGDLRLG